MGIREKLNERRHLTMIVAAALTAIAVLALAMELRSQNASPQTPFGKAFYTTDDGKSWFIDEGSNLAPFDRDGKEAVKAYLFTCDSGTTRWVGYLERYTPDGKSQAEEMLSGKDQAKAGVGTIVMDMEVKRPGQPTWCHLQNFQQASAIMNIRCPHGTHVATSVEP